MLVVLLQGLCNRYYTILLCLPSAPFAPGEPGGPGGPGGPSPFNDKMIYE